MQLYAEIDLHASNNYLAVIDVDGKRMFRRKMSNEPRSILSQLENFKEGMVGVVVESTFNWYRLVDLLVDAGYRVHLANPPAIQKYSGLKHADDNHDAFWLAEMLRLGILPKGYIYPTGLYCSGRWSPPFPAKPTLWFELHRFPLCRPMSNPAKYPLAN